MATQKCALYKTKVGGKEVVKCRTHPSKSGMANNAAIKSHVDKFQKKETNVPVKAPAKAPAKVARKVAVKAPDAAPKRPVGRPRKNAPAADPVPVKRGPGRPRKVVDSAPAKAPVKRVVKTSIVGKAAKAPAKAGRPVAVKFALTTTITFTDGTTSVKASGPYKTDADLLDAMDGNITAWSAKVDKAGKKALTHYKKVVSTWAQVGTAVFGSAKNGDKGIAIAGTKWDASTDKWQFRVDGNKVGTRTGLADPVRWRTVASKKASK